MKWLRFSLPVAVLIVSAVFVFAAQRESAKVASRRLAWDYKFIMVGENTKKWESALLDLGAEGWECVGYSFLIHSGTSGEEVLILKRQKQL